MRYCFLFFCLLSVPGLVQRATFQENARSFVTYPFSYPDPVARPGRFYPYFRFDGYTKQGKPQSWNMVELENDYIKLAVTCR